MHNTLTHRVKPLVARNSSFIISALNYAMCWWTLQDGDVTSQILLLNGAPLTYGGVGKLDPAVPTSITDPSTPIMLAPISVGFIVLTDASNHCA